ncbi:DUF4333 domain-containing protein [Geodermatophilus sp. DSM 44513]|uniref:DUF4333 domain-containing protein n=1 Tax=Geodermatophilus sp. DSM 44513 TaxID=1528104 RepID=UPI001276A826|nr:DUF4333 domain-containing protein [Geodermatophilus sp. DSM 44513]WNV75845.1 DUF4333 domain-containing protein [Geodermatophilus sp. DSM 44513]
MPRHLLAAPVLALGLTACGASVAQAELEARVAGALQARSGVAPAVSCPGDLDAEVDASTECTAVDPATGERTAWRVVVTAVADGVADFDVERVD